MSCIVLICGAIGTGKSTFLKQLFHNQRDATANTDGSLSKCDFGSLSDKSLCLISFDELCSIEDQAKLMKSLRGWRTFRNDVISAVEHMMGLTGHSGIEPEKELSSQASCILEKFQILHPDNVDKILFVEDNFYYRSMRYEWFRLARKANIGFCQIYMTCSLETALQRNGSRGYCIPEEAVRRVYASMEFPDPQKYKWEKYSYVLDTSAQLEPSAVHEICDIIQRAIQDPAEMILNRDKLESQEKCLKSVIHQADRILRKIVKDKILHLEEESNVDRGPLKAQAPLLIAARQEVLVQLKQGCVHLPDHITENLRNSGIDSVQQEMEDVLNELFEHVHQQNTCIMLETH